MLKKLTIYNIKKFTIYNIKKFTIYNIKKFTIYKVCTSNMIKFNLFFTNCLARLLCQSRMVQCLFPAPLLDSVTLLLRPQLHRPARVGGGR